ncbi:tetratricopeptide repeat domain 27 [Dentipellis sp. KUC8613]|nr:tetratricopeptide repeat domain 27 [Dentipellis sp. KUC8613]
MSVDRDALQKSLLTGKWHAPADPQAQSAVVDLARTVVEGKFGEVLTSPYARSAFALQEADLAKLADRPLKEWFVFGVEDVRDEAEREMVRLLLAVACLNAFVQVNWTGPDLDFKLLDVLGVPADGASSITEELLQKKSISELAYGGEPVYHLAQALFLFRLARLLLDLPYHHAPTADWWRLRAWNVHEQILDEPVAVPTEQIPPLEPLAESFADDFDLVGRLWLERGLLDHYQGNDKNALDFFVRAARATDLQYELVGALGKRTKFQETDLSQLVLLAESRKREGEDAEEKKEATSNGSTSTDAPKVPETLALNDDTLLEQTEFTSSRPAAAGSRLSHLDPSSQPALHPLDQCILLSLCLNVRNTSPAHGLTNEQMSPYVARVISHPENWSVHTMALLLRSRLEAHRTRTVERSTLQLQALVDQMPTADSTVPERLRFVHSIPLPSKWEMERELALRFLSIGVVKSALAIFERLEMWEEAVKCWQATEQRATALAVVRDLLAGRRAEAELVLTRGKAVAPRARVLFDAAREAKLWCLLGELEPEHAVEHYQHAWAVSKGTSGRAMRSLGGYHFTRGEFGEAAECLRKAVAINPLLSRSWFILGCACVRIEDWAGARDAFGRCVAIDDEDGESWNNLASVYLRMGASKTVAADGEDEAGENAPAETFAIPFEHKMLAYRALKQGLRFSYDNWRMWMNYMIVAMDVGELAEASRALGRIVEERSAKIGADAVDEDVLDRLVDAVTRAPANPDEAVEGSGTAQNAARNPNEGHGLLKRVEDLIERVILPRVSSTRVFRARARLLTWQGRWEEAIQAYLEGYRLSVAGKMEQGETDIDKWRAGVHEVEEIVDVLTNFGPRVEGFKWKMQARSIVRTFMGRTKDFEDEPEWGRLVDLLEEIKRAE